MAVVLYPSGNAVKYPSGSLVSRTDVTLQVVVYPSGNPVKYPSGTYVAYPTVPPSPTTATGNFFFFS